MRCKPALYALPAHDGRMGVSDESRVLVPEALCCSGLNPPRSHGSHKTESGRTMTDDTVECWMWQAFFCACFCLRLCVHVCFLLLASVFGTMLLNQRSECAPSSHMSSNLLCETSSSLSHGRWRQTSHQAVKTLRDRYEEVAVLLCRVYA